MQKNIFSHIAESKLFQRSIIGVIVFAALLVGLETYPDIYAKYKSLFHSLDLVIQGIFTVEILIRILAYGKRPFQFFTSSINVFDFIVTAIFYLPFGGTYASIFRLVRILRVLRLITALPRLQILVGSLLKSVPSMGYISLLLLLQMYIFAVLGNFLFGKNDPLHFGDLGIAMFTLFKIITLEGWIEILEAQPQNILTMIYFISFIIIGTMIVLNLFIGVILNGFEEVKDEVEKEMQRRRKKTKTETEILHISEQLEDLKRRLDTLIASKKIR